jgi:tRNA1(Val) A37 N6-methylase TrmN6
MNCCQIQGLEMVFDQPTVAKELDRYRRKGPGKSTRMLIEAVKAEEVSGKTLLDIGGGVGAVQHALLKDGLRQATDVDASEAYLEAARSEAQRRGLDNQITFFHGNFIDFARQIPPADIVTLDRVICCFPDMEQLVSLSAVRAKQAYGLVYPRQTWWLKALMRLANFYFKLHKNPYRMFLHPDRKVEDILTSYGFKRQSYTRSFIWQVAVYTRQA